MKMFLRILVFLQLILMLLSVSVKGQGIEGSLVLDGRVKTFKGRVDSIEVIVRQQANGVVIARQHYDEVGRFKIPVPLQGKYLLEVRHDGFYTKQYEIDTRVPVAVLAEDDYFPPYELTITLTRAVSGHEPDFCQHPIGRIFYSTVQDDFDAEAYFDDGKIHRQIVVAQEKYDEKRLNEQLALVERLQEAGDYQGADLALLTAAQFDGTRELKQRLKNARLENKKLVKTAVLRKPIPAEEEAQFEQHLAEAEELLQGERLEEARMAFEKALAVKPEQRSIREKINLLEQELMQRNAIAREYNRTVALADEFLNQKNYEAASAAYQRAQKMKPRESYPKEQLSEIAQIEAEIAADMSAYEAEIKRGDAFFAEENYPAAILAYQLALELNPEQEYPQSRMNDATALLSGQKARQAEFARMAALERRFEELMTIGNKAYEKRSFGVARDYFAEAYTLKEDVIARARYRQADEMAKAQQAQEPEVVYAAGRFEDLLKKAGEAFALGHWKAARAQYFEALQVQGNESYPMAQIRECDAFIAANISEAKYQVFNQLVAAGDAEFASGAFALAQINYQNALAIKQWDTHSRSRLNEILSRLLSWASDTERQQFVAALKDADRAFRNGDFAVARFYYRKANEIKEEPYASGQLKEIERLLAGALQELVDRDYREAIDKADEAFNGKNPTVARFYYLKAQSLKPNEAYPQLQLKKLGR